MLQKTLFVAALLVAGSVLHPELATAHSADLRGAKLFGQDTMRVPYTAGRVYEIRLIPGAPFAVELPAGETAKNIWFPASSRTRRRCDFVRSCLMLCPPVRRTVRR